MENGNSFQTKLPNDDGKVLLMYWVDFWDSVARAMSARIEW